MKNVTVLNTGESIKNEFFLINLENELDHNSSDKELKIKTLEEFYFTKDKTNPSYKHLPPFLKRHKDLLNIIQGEYLLEKYRQKNYPEYPSRVACLFVFHNLEDLATACRIPGWRGEIFKIKIISPDYKVTKHNMEFSSAMQGYHNPIIQRAASENNYLSKYWTSDSSIIDYTPYGWKMIYYPIYEYLIEGEYKVIKYNNGYFEW